MDNINKKIKEVILKSKLPISVIARKTGISRQYIYKIINNESISISSDVLQRICEAINIDVSELYKKKGIKIPVLGYIPAGIPIDAIEDILDYEEISEDLARKGEYFGLKVKGDSMAPLILDKDILIIRQQQDADSGDICAVLVNGFEATVKKIRKNLNGIWLIPNNPAYETKFYSNEEILNLPLTILGKVVECRRSF